MSLPRKLRRAAPLLHFDVARDEPGESAAGGDLQTRPKRSQPSDLEKLDCFADSFDSGLSKRLELEIALDEAARRTADYRRAGRRQALKAESRRPGAV